MIVVSVEQLYPVQLTHDEVVALAKALSPAWEELRAKYEAHTLSDEEATTLFNLMSLVWKLPDLEKEETYATPGR